MPQVLNNKQLRAAVYIRVSTEDQRKGYGLDFQLEDTKRAAIERDGCIVKKELIFDDTKSGSDDNRPGWQKLMEMARKKEFDVVYFWKLDRMMRSERHFYKNEEQLEQLNIELRFATQDLQDPFTKAIHVAVAAEERRKILERTKRGREMAARAGKWVMGTPPYGYKLDKIIKKAEVVPEEAKWVKKFYEWLVYDSCTLLEIANRANALNVPKWADNREIKRKPRMWWPRTLGRILSNEVYTGTTYFKKYKSRFRGIATLLDSSLVRDRESWIPIEVPAIISRELFTASLKQLTKNREFALRKAKRSYLYSKIIYCGVCGYRLRGRYFNADGTRRYHGTVDYRSKDYSKRCNYCGEISEIRLEPIWNSLKLILMDPNFVYEKLRHYTQRGNKQNRINDRLKEIVDEMNLLDKKLKMLNIAFLDINSIDEHEYKKRLQSIQSSREKILTERIALNQYIQNTNDSGSTQVIEELHHELKENIETASYETKCKIIRRCIERINLYIEKNAAEVVFNFEAQLMQDNNLDTCPTKNYTLTVNIPLISINELRKSAAKFRSHDPKHYRKKKIAIISNLAIQKAKEMYL